MRKYLQHGRRHLPHGSDPIGLGAFVLASTDLQDVSALGTVGMAWTDIYNNSSDFDSLTALPDELGLDFAFDGSGGGITVTENGVWAFTYNVANFAAGSPDPTWAGNMRLSPVGLGQTALPSPAVSVVTAVEMTEVLALPAGAAFFLDIVTTVPATASPYNLDSEMAITRIA